MDAERERKLRRGEKKEYREDERSRRAEEAERKREEAGKKREEKQQQRTAKNGNATLSEEGTHGASGSTLRAGGRASAVAKESVSRAETVSGTEGGGGQVLGHGGIRKLLADCNETTDANCTTTPEAYLESNIQLQNLAMTAAPAAVITKISDAIQSVANVPASLVSVTESPFGPNIYYFRVDAYNTTHLDTIFNKLQAGLVTALNNLDWTGLKPPPGPPVEAAYQGEGIQKLFCGDGSVASRSEECDQGEALNGDQFECGSECRCTPGHIAIDGICTCDSTVSAWAWVEESTRIQGASNDVTLAVSFNGIIQGLNGKDQLNSPTVVTITGLTGSQTPTNSALSLQDCSGPPRWGAQCGVGLRPASSASGIWRRNVVDWNQETGTLKFTVLNDINPAGIGVDYQTSSTVYVTVRLTNRAVTQPAVTPTLQICQQDVVDVSGHALASNQVEISAGGVLEIHKVDGDANTAVVATLTLTGDSLPAGGKVVVEALETGPGWDLTGLQYGKVPYQSAFAGLEGTAMQITVYDASSEVVPLSEVGSSLTMQIENSLLRLQGGCYTDDDKTISVCVPGYSGLYEYSEASEKWVLLSGADFASRSAASFSTRLSGSGLFAVMTIAPCYDYEGQGKAGGDRVCAIDPESSSDPSTPALLGGGTMSKMPSVSRATRPAISSLAALKEYIAGDTSGGARMYTTRTPWYDWTPLEGALMPARFGHSMAAVDGTRILIYGGTGCLTMNNVTGHCEAFSAPMSDLWEFDTLKASAGQLALREILMSPTLAGRNGQAMVSLAAADHHVMVFGGNANFFVMDHAAGTVKLTTEENFEVRDLEFRSRKAGDQQVSGVGSLSAMAVASNSTHVMLFGGFLSNALTAAVWTYSLSAASASLGLQAMPAYSVGPDSRGFPGLIKPDDNTLIMYGGVSGGVGLGDLWALDVSTQNWAKLHDSIPTTPPPASFTAFAQIAEQTAGEGTTLISAGGILGGYKSGVTFMKGADISDTENQPTSDAYAWNSGSMVQGQDPSMWFTTRTAGSEYGDGLYGCCDFADTCPEEFQGVGCGLPAAASYSMVFGYFSAGMASFLLYGGLDRDGDASSEMWYIDVSNEEIAFLATLSVGGIEYADFDAQLFVEALVQHPWCPERTVIYEPKVYPDGASTPADPLVTVQFILSWNEWMNCVIVNAFDGNVFEWSPSILNTTMEGVYIPEQLLDDTDALIPTEVRLPVSQWRTTEDCDFDCVRGFCQADYEIDEYTPKGSSLYEDDGKVRNCFSNSDGSMDSSCMDDSGEYQGYSCSLPGPLHGHTAEQVMLGGQVPIMLLLGGERTGFWAEEAELSMDVYGGAFVSGNMVIAKLRAVDLYGTDCEFTDAIGDLALCPEPRRDAAVAVMGNTGGSNGKLLMFGGMGVGTDTISPFRSYLEGGQVDLQAFNDLWFLDLTDLTEECIKGGECEPLPWEQVDVLGNKPRGRWGAGLMLDPSDNLYVIGGTNYDTTTKGYSDLEDLYIFQLRDPFYKYCSATGGGLINAIAGVPAYFLIQCRDAFGEMASGATFRVEIVGLDSQPGLTPSPYSVGTGLYRCDYTVILRGAYEIRIYVGRGGTAYQDLIAGVDAEVSNDDHDFFYEEHVSTAARVFSLTVTPGSTDAAASTVSSTTSLTTTTAGVITSFTVTASDAFGNRRPGGEVINALMSLWDVPNNKVADPDLTPETAAITDNKDGRYSASYRITRSGVYQLSIALSGGIGAGSPYQLLVASDKADISRTYVFGPFEQVKTGRTTTLFVQTRDQFGNNLRVDPKIFASGSETIGFELCKTKGKGADNETCAGGEEEPNVGVTITYSYGPDAQQKNTTTGEYYYGLYKIDFYPFNSGEFTPQVKHNSTYVSCYFDSTAVIDFPDLQRPSIDAVDDCASSVSASTVSRGNGHRGGRRWTTAPQMVVKSGQARRAAAGDKQVVWEESVMDIEQVFQTPDTEFELTMLVVSPILCALVAVLIELGCMGLEWRRAKEERNMNRIANENTDKIRASIDGAPPPTEPAQIEWSASGGEVSSASRTLPPSFTASGNAREHDPTWRALNSLAETQGLISDQTLKEAMKKAEGGDPEIIALLAKHQTMLLDTAQQMESLLVSSRSEVGPLPNDGEEAASIPVEDAMADDQRGGDMFSASTDTMKTDHLGH